MLKIRTLNFLKSQYTLLFRDLPRTSVMLLIGWALLRPDAATWVLLSYSFGIAMFLVAASHFTRRLLFPTIDVSSLILEAKKGNLAAAVASIAMCSVSIALMFIMAMPFFNR